MRAIRILAGLCLAAACVVAPARAADPWSAPAPVPGSSGAGFPYDVAAAGDGTAAVAYIQDGIRVAVRRPGGDWTRPRKVSSGRTGVASPDVEIDRRGEILVAWTQNTVLGPAPPRGPNYVRIAIRGVDGSWSDPRTVGRTRHFVDGDPRLATDGNGDAVVGWRGLRRMRSGVHDGLQVAYRPAGGAFGSARSLEDGAIDHAVAIDDRGAAYATWAVTVPPAHVRSAIRLARRTSSGAWTRPVTVFADRAGSPQLGLPGDGSLLLAWRGSQQGIGATRTGFAMAAEGRPGGPIGPAKVLSAARTLGPKLAVTRSGEAMVAWTAVGGALDPSAGAPALYWTARPAGATFGPVEMAPSLRSDALAMLADGTAVTVWSGTALRAAVRPAGGLFGDAELISSRGDFPVLAAGDRMAIAVWLQDGRLMAAVR
jgi:hypothetical protein